MKAYLSLVKLHRNEWSQYMMCQDLECDSADYMFRPFTYVLFNVLFCFCWILNRQITMSQCQDWQFNISSTQSQQQLAKRNIGCSFGMCSCQITPSWHCLPFGARHLSPEEPSRQAHTMSQRHTVLPDLCSPLSLESFGNQANKCRKYMNTNP